MQSITTRMKLILITVVFISLSGCIDLNEITRLQQDKQLYEEHGEAAVTITPEYTASMEPLETPPDTRQSDLMIDRISGNLTSFYEKKWYTLYQADELDCSRMSTYLWQYLRNEYHVAPKIIVSYERQHAWLALKVRDVGNSTNYRHWNIKGMEYYYLEATIPKIVVDDNQRFLINGKPYTSAEFYDASIYVFDTPQDANDFHAEKSMLGGWNQEFRLKYDDLDKINAFLK